MCPRPRSLWKAFLRLLILILAGLCVLGLYLWRSPSALRQLILAVPLPGVAEFPAAGPTPLPPRIDGPAGSPPPGPLALWGDAGGLQFGCSFLLELDDGQIVGVSAAHATQPLPRHAAGQMRAVGSSLATSIDGQLAIGQAFVHNHFNMDYALWSLAAPPATHPLRPDPRGAAQPGERIWVMHYNPDSTGGSVRRAGGRDFFQPGGHLGAAG